MAQRGIFVADEPYNRGVNLTASDSTDLAQVSDALYVGEAGDAVVRGEDGVEFTLLGLVAGTILPIRIRRLLTTDGGSVTTDASLVALYW